MGFKARVNAINLIITQKIATEDDISAIIGKLAINVTFAREKEILRKEEPKDKELAKMFKYLN